MFIKYIIMIIKNIKDLLVGEPYHPNCIIIGVRISFGHLSYMLVNAILIMTNRNIMGLWVRILTIFKIFFKLNIEELGI